MDVETSWGEKFLLDIESSEEIAVAVHMDGGEKIFLPEKNSSSGTYYHETTDTLVETAKGYRLKLESEPESFEIIS
jgi:hypothetical protein